MKSAMVLPSSPGAAGHESLPTDSWGGETDWSLIRNASGGATPEDRDKVWVKLIHRYERPVRRVLARHLRGDPAVDDAVSDFFSDLFQKRQILERWDPSQGRFRCYIQGVIRRYALQWKRARSTSALHDVDAIDVPDETRNEVEHEEELIWADAILEHALGRLRGLSKNDAETLLGFYGLFGHTRRSGEEIARERNVSLATFHVALHRARLKLRAALYEELKPMVTSDADMLAEQEFLVGRLCAAHPGFDLDARG